MPSLKQAVAEKKAQEPALRRNPEIDAKLDKFIGENPKLVEYYNGLSKDDLIRKLMLGKMQKAEYSNGRNEEIKAWVEEHPEIKAKIEERLRNVPEANRERAFINAAKTEAMNQTVRPNGVRVEPRAFRGAGASAPAAFLFMLADILDCYRKHTPLGGLGSGIRPIIHAVASFKVFGSFCMMKTSNLAPEKLEIK
jgi:hypothetical protein